MQVLLVDDDECFTEAWRTFAAAWRPATKEASLNVVVASDIRAATAALAAKPFDAVLLDVGLADGDDGLAALQDLQRHTTAPIVVHSVRHDHHTIVRAMRAGAHDYLPKHLGVEAACEALWQLHTSAPQTPHPDVVAHADAQDGGTGRSAAMQALARDMAVAKRSRGNVLVYGEPGSGKERVARAFAEETGPFVAIDAGTLDESLASGLLFGAVRGAYTGADRERPGLIEQAHQGTLFIDEVANLSLAVQAKLLRVLQEREVLRLGGTKRRPVRCRVVAATNVDLAAHSQINLFRYDLYTRLAVFVLRVPPLRERQEDIAPLFQTFLRAAGPGPDKLAPPVVRALCQRPWWGNVRELEHAAYVARARAQSEDIAAAHLPPPLAAPPQLPESVAAAPVANDDAEKPFASRMRAHERDTLEAAYNEASGNISRMARMLGLDRSRLYGKLRHHGIHASRERP